MKKITSIVVLIAFLFSSFSFNSSFAEDGGESTALKDFLTDVEIDAPIDPDTGNYIMYPEAEYNVKFTFAEKEGLQFENGSELTYNIPSSMTVADITTPVSFPIVVSSDNGSVIVEGNTFRVENGKLVVKFNENDPHFSDLVATSNVKFEVNMGAVFDENESEVEFNEIIKKEITFNDDADLSIEKTGIYDATTGKVTYTVKIKSTGVNKDVVINDAITGTALNYDLDSLTMTSDKVDPVSFTVASQNADGFTANVAKLRPDENLTLTYTASVDYDELFQWGTVEETSNKVSVKSDKVPEPKEDEFNFKGLIKFKAIRKGGYADTKPLEGEDDKYLVHWTIHANEDNRLTMGGKEIYDYIKEEERSRQSFHGTGIKVKVKKNDGTTETRDIPWDQLETEEENGKIIAWKYKIPDGDGKFAYEIKADTIVDMEGIPGSLDLHNNVQFDKYKSNPGATVGTGVGTAIEKTAVEVTSDKIKWQIKVTDIPATGINGTVQVTDALPRYTNPNGVVWLDTAVNSTIQVEGLRPEESYKPFVQPSGNGMSIGFYQDSEQTIKGLLPSEGCDGDVVPCLSPRFWAFSGNI